MLMVERRSWAAALAVPTLHRGSDVAASPLREQQHPANTGRWSISSHGAGALGVLRLSFWPLASCRTWLGGPALGLGCERSSPEFKMLQPNGRRPVCS